MASEGIEPVIALGPRESLPSSCGYRLEVTPVTSEGTGEAWPTPGAVSCEPRLFSKPRKLVSFAPFVPERACLQERVQEGVTRLSMVCHRLWQSARPGAMPLADGGR